MGSTIDGLVSGLSTSSLISSLMQVEAAPQTTLKGKVTKQQTALNSYQSMNSKLAALETAAQNMQKLSTWRAVAPTSSSTAVTAVATSSNNNATGTVTFDVTRLAQAQVSTIDAPAATTDILSGNPSSINVTVAGVVTAVPINGDQSLQGVANALNNSATGLKATVVTGLVGGVQRSILQINGPKTGAANNFSIAGLSGSYSLANITAAQDAELKIGGASAGAYSVTSDTNQFDKLIAGTSITVSKVETGVTVGATTDTKAIADMMQKVVDAANTALSEVKTQTKTTTGTTGGKTTVTGGPLSGDFMIRQISDKILSTVSNGLSTTNGDPVNYGSLSKLGIDLTSDGSMKFDATKFTSAYTADPTAVKAAASAFAAKVEKVADNQQINVGNVITSRTTMIKNLNDQISQWDVRLSTRQAALQKQFSNLETSLSSMQSQSNWLSGQLAGLG